MEIKRYTNSKVLYLNIHALNGTPQRFGHTSLVVNTMFDHSIVNLWKAKKKRFAFQRIDIWGIEAIHILFEVHYFNNLFWVFSAKKVFLKDIYVCVSFKISKENTIKIRLRNAIKFVDFFKFSNMTKNTFICIVNTILWFHLEYYTDVVNVL